ncbi:MULTISPECIES: hypothetical protein [unclassified Pseudomonas]|jgi:hypothetical protein|uniref:hypothetical protein n=1 Tax=unclassified Pseudomonas TaxID=196821 RepID=UPI000C8833B8|nr:MULTISPECIES: hypothetical protein [unclassified Pseudomonas]MBL1311223.1 hypothetical protein [Pseudomonas sp.]PMX19147.1 hypothetical protein C1Y25_00660 [Pseudomonas sp. MPBC4-3]PMX50108.1 hypothetical protein C1Y20_04375 [Pseudomonas sp. FW301-21B01]PMY10824.1 hypothetical protein C1Y18_02205 [Pseudomonas sp. MPR-R5A]PNA72991.1 hypothetical protein C1Y14_01760 [Pseudomonas sp. MPR-R5B]
MSAVQRFHEAANDALVKLSGYCLPGAKLALIIVTPGEPERDIILQDQGLDRNEVVSALRRRGLSIDGDNAYKRDLCDAIVGALAMGTQNTNPPPADHWGQRFWDIGREERQLHEELVAALKLTRENLRACQATIHLCGGFDPAYVNNAQAAMKVADDVLAKATR